MFSYKSCLPLKQFNLEVYIILSIGASVDSHLSLFLLINIEKLFHLEFGSLVYPLCLFLLKKNETRCEANVLNYDCEVRDTLYIYYECLFLHSFDSALVNSSLLI